MSPLMFLLTTFILVVLCTWLWLMKQKLGYWQRLHLPFVKPLPLVGNLKDLFLVKISFGEIFHNLYHHPEASQAPAVGIYLLNKPALLLRDPELIRLVFIKHSDKFQNRYEAADAVHDRMGALTLPLSKFPIWWGCRKKMSAAFTSGQIKFRMYPLMLRVTHELEQFLARKLKGNPSQDGVVVEVKEMLALFTTDLTSVLHYGKDVKGLAQGYSVLREQTLKLFDIGIRRLLDFFIIFFCPELTSWLRAKLFSPTYAKFIRQFTQELYEERKERFGNECKQGNLVDILLQFQRENLQDPLHYSQHKDFVASQVAIFLLAGFETSSSVIGFTLYELAKQQDVQLKLRLELKQAFGQRADLAYEELQALPYLQQVLCEGLRMYPAAAFINRECTTRPRAKGFQLTSDIFIPNGMPVYVSILALHRDAKHWHNPHKFQPERFVACNLQSINPMVYQPFGVGPHSCIGSRLGLLQVKLALAHILKLYRVYTCSSTAKEIQFDPRSFMLLAKGGIYLKFIRDDL
uniref:Cytochrome P450 n=1 Tax=Stomoxys calcitrans TaxID=35570 RepID=A0A1I8PDH4_STOCA